MIRVLNKFRKTRTGYVVFGLIEPALAYLFGSLAVNSGSLLQWALAVVLLLGFMQNFVRLIWKFVHGGKVSKA